MAKAIRKFKVTLKNSLIGSTQSQRKTMEALGLKKIGQTKVHNDSPAFRGQIVKVQHLLSVAVEK